MIITNLYSVRDDGIRLFRTYSDSGFMIRQEQTGLEYAEAIDIENSGYTYIETNILTEDDITPEEALNILLGGDTNEPN